MELAITTPIKGISGIGPVHEKRLERLGILTLRDLLFYFPWRYEDLSQISPIAALTSDVAVSVQGLVRSIKNRRGWKSKRFITDVLLEDESGSIPIIWFNQPYLTKSISAGQYLAIAGKPSLDEKGHMRFISPDFEMTSSRHLHTSRIVPIYWETSGLTSKWLRWKIYTFLSALEGEIPEVLPPDISARYHLLELKKALWQVHFPDTLEQARRARARFSFQELLKIRLRVLLEKESQQNEKAISIPFSESFMKDVVKSFPFSLTQDQRKATWEIVKDVGKPCPMQRLLEGDVGTGKTLVALLVASLVAHAKKQVAFLAPTEILASQHFATFIRLLEPFNLSIGLFTRSQALQYDPAVDHVRELSPTQLKEKTKSGEISILIGTHAILSSKLKAQRSKLREELPVSFKNLALVVIDEQHRFGVEQRSQLLTRFNPRPHFLTMTATPIPRSLALTRYGSLDTSRLIIFPQGQRHIITRIIAPQKRKAAYEVIREKLRQGQQLYVICPIIEESEKIDTKAALAVWEELRTQVFPEFECALLHGRMKSKEKEAVMRQFLAKEVMVLVATSVVEVGVDVPEAGIMIIEGAERFGLAQIHQLRGRIGRRGQGGQCLLFTNSQAKATAERLKALSMSDDGFFLAQKDLEIRGPGQLMGTRQAGMSDIAMEALGNNRLLTTITKEAQRLLKESPDLSRYPGLAQQVKNLYGFLHME